MNHDNHFKESFNSGAVNRILHERLGRTESSLAAVKPIFGKKGIQNPEVFGVVMKKQPPQRRYPTVVSRGIQHPGHVIP